MDCAEAKLRIEPYVAGELSDGEKAPLEEHLASCAECRLDSELTRASKRTPTVTEAAGFPAEGGIANNLASEAAALASGEPERPGRPQGDWTLESIFGSGASSASGKPDDPPAPSGSATPPIAADAAPAPTPAAAAPTPAPPAPTPAASEPTPAAPPAPVAAAPAPAFEPAAAFEASPAYEPAPVPDTFDHPLESPDGALPEVLHGSEGPDESEAAMAGAGTSTPSNWDFEPADHKGDVKPPEGSLFFAEEALARGDAAEKGAPSALKLVLWCVGGVVGLGLLGVSVWIALTIRQPSPPSNIPARRPITASTVPDAPAIPGEAAPEGSAPEPAAEEVSPEPAPAPQAPTTAEATEKSAAERRARREAAPSEAPPVASKPAAKTVAPRPSQTAPKATATTAPIPAPSRDPERQLAALRPAGTSSGTSENPQVAPSPTPQRTAPPSSTTPSETAPAPSTRDPFAPSGAPAGGTTPSSPPPAAPPAATPPAGTAAPAAPPAETVQRPIDRLHIATLNAEQNADVAALRKMRETWRNFMKTSIGPDRSRAKRELADCLWALQTLTAKTSDQKEALVAYRDYVLNAPAGGADARTVARMRQLEDAIAESR